MAGNTIGKRDKALHFISSKGPVLPIQIGRELEIDTMFAGAILSELVNEAKLFVTEHLRVGGSPVYYMKGQEEKLENYLKYLNENDIKTLQILKEKNIVRDKDCTPLQRVSYRIVKDFAKNLILKKDNGEKEIFWRYYLVDDDVAKEKILDMINRKESQKKIEVKNIEEINEELVEPEKKEIIKPKKEEIQESEEFQEEIQEPEKEEKPKQKLRKDSSVDVVKEFFRINGITVWEEKVIRKDKDVNYVISFETKLGNLKYFAKFRDKKRISEGDISLAYNEAGKLPLMFLSKGELTKPAKNIIQTEYRGVVFKKV